MSDVHYFFYDEKAKRVCGFGNIAPENWDIHQGQMQYRMVPIWDPAQLDMLREHGPNNFVIGEDYSVNLLPDEQRNLTPMVIDNHDDGMAALNRKMDTLIDLMRPIAEALKKL